MKYFPKDTLAYFKSAPQFQKLDFSAMPLPALGAATKEYKETGYTSASPDHDALRFYLLNHCAQIVRSRFTDNEPLPGWAHNVMDLYLSEVVAQGERLFHYLMLIITRESRHCQGLRSKNGLSPKKFSQFEDEEAHWKYVEDRFSPTFAKMMYKKLGKGSGETFTMNAYLEGLVTCTAEQFVEGIAYCFIAGLYPGSYGGKPWQDISLCTLAMLRGHTSIEMMLDTAYTLAHNNGPIFNKGMLYVGYQPSFKTLLDIQRAGQIPQLVLESLKVSKPYHGIEIPETAKSLMISVQNNLPEPFPEFVDWYGVEASGALGSYEKFKKTQKALHPESVAKWNAPAFDMRHGEKVEFTGEYDLFPGQSAKVYKRVKNEVAA